MRAYIRVCPRTNRYGTTPGGDIMRLTPNPDLCFSRFPRETRGIQGNKRDAKAMDKISSSIMPRPEYKDPKMKTIYLEKVRPTAKDQFLDICHKLDLNQSETFEEVIQFYYSKHKVKPRPSRKKG
jgi:hypothetical protein